MGKYSLRAGRSILSGPGVLVLIFLAVDHPTRELLIGLNEAGHSGQKFGIGGGEGCIGTHQFLYNSILRGSCRREGVKIFVEVGNQPVRTICLIILIWFRRLPKWDVIGAKLFVASHDLLLYLGLPIWCSVQIFTGRPNLLFPGQVLPYFVRSEETLRRKHRVYRNEDEVVLSHRVTRSLGAFLQILKRIGVLEDSLHVLMIVLHLILKCQHIEAMEANT